MRRVHYFLFIGAYQYMVYGCGGRLVVSELENGYVELIAKQHSVIACQQDKINELVKKREDGNRSKYQYGLFYELHPEGGNPFCTIGEIKLHQASEEKVDELINEFVKTKRITLLRYDYDPRSKQVLSPSYVAKVRMESCISIRDVVDHPAEVKPE